MATRFQIPSALREAAQAVALTRGRLLQLQRTFDHSCIPMVMVDNDRRVLDANAAAKFVARMPQQQLCRLRLDDVTAAQDLTPLAWNELLRRGTGSGRYLVTFTDGSTLWVFYAAMANALPGRHLIVFVPADWPGSELEELHPAAEPTRGGALSTRQVEVLRLVAMGANAGEIAAELSISEATVRTHVKNILERLGAKNRAHAVALAMCNGLLGDQREEERSVARNGGGGADAVGAASNDAVGAASNRNGPNGSPTALKLHSATG